MEIYHTKLKTGITRTKEFEKKKLATHSVNVGTRCGHQCSYCSSPALLRMHPSFQEAGVRPFSTGYAIVDSHTPERVEGDARRLRHRGLIQLCTTTDAWSPEAQQYDLGRRCLQAILSQPGWSVRILTKNVAVENDFDLISKHRDRVLVGLSITGTEAKNGIISTIEPYASPIHDRIAVMRKAAEAGFRTYAMFCPLMPGIADSPDQVEELMVLAEECQAEECFIEPVNPRGRGLLLTEEALRNAGYHPEAAAVGAIRHRRDWSEYVLRLLRTVQQSIRRKFDICRLRFLLYPSRLLPEYLAKIRTDDQGVVWL